MKNIPSGSGRDAIPSPNEFNHLDWLKPLIVHRESQSNFKLANEVEDKSDGEQYQEEGFDFDSLPSAFDNAAESDQESRPESCNSDISNLQFSSGNIEDNAKILQHRKKSHWEIEKLKRLTPAPKKDRFRGQIGSEICDT